MTIVLKQYTDVLKYLRSFVYEEQVSTNEKAKVLVLTKTFRGKQLRIC